jgi:hypothetical protein
MLAEWVRAEAGDDLRALFGVPVAARHAAI